MGSLVDHLRECLNVNQGESPFIFELIRQIRMKYAAKRIIEVKNIEIKIDGQHRIT